VIQPVLHLHECTDPAPAEFATTTESVTATESVAAKSAAEPLHSVADFATCDVAYNLMSH
jgi:hypothetical protein